MSVFILIYIWAITPPYHATTVYIRIMIPSSIKSFKYGSILFVLSWLIAMNCLFYLNYFLSLFILRLQFNPFSKKIKRITMIWYHDMIRRLNNIKVLQGNLIVTNAFTSKIWIEQSLNDAICQKCAYLFLNCIFANYVATPYATSWRKKTLIKWAKSDV